MSRKCNFWRLMLFVMCGLLPPGPTRADQDWVVIEDPTIARDACCDSGCDACNYDLASQWIVSAEFLYWNPRTSNLDFAVNSPSRNPNELIDGEVIGLDYPASPGLRAGLERRLASNWWLGADYSFFESDDSRSTTAPPGGSIQSTRLHPTSSIGTHPFAEASANVRYHVLDVMAERRWNPTSQLGLRAAIGARGVDFDSGYVASFDTDSEVIHQKYRFRGGGVRIGTRVDWRLRHGWSIVGGLHGSVLAGTSHTSYFERDRADRRAVVDRTYYNAIPVIETMLGVEWSRGFVTLAVGYEFQLWQDLSQRLIFTDATTEGSQMIDAQSLGLDGLTARVALSW